MRGTEEAQQMIRTTTTTIGDTRNTADDRCEENVTLSLPYESVNKSQLASWLSCASSTKSSQVIVNGYEVVTGDRE